MVRNSATLFREFRYWKRFVDRQLKNVKGERIWYGAFQGWKGSVKKYWKYDEHKPWTQEFISENTPNLFNREPMFTKKTYLQPIDKWIIFPGDFVQILAGPDKGKQGYVDFVIEERNWCYVKNLHCQYKLENMPGSAEKVCRKVEQPLLVTREVKLVDPLDGKPTDVEWKYDSEGNELRVSMRTGREISIPDKAKFFEDMVYPDAYVGAWFNRTFNHSMQSIRSFHTSTNYLIRNFRKWPPPPYVSIGTDPEYASKETHAKKNVINSWRNAQVAQHFSPLLESKASISRGCALFDEEWERQKRQVGSDDKIMVQILDESDDYSLSMNRGLSTPYDCTRHISELLMKRSVVALVDGKLWDMNKPLLNDCTLKLLHCKALSEYHVQLVNSTFWRSCTFLLGSLLTTCFDKKHMDVQLCSFPPPLLTSGSFVYDVSLSLKNWKPSGKDLNDMNRIMYKLLRNSHQFSSLSVSMATALEMFQDYPFKLKQIPIIASGDSMVTVYRVADHIDISNGPMIGNTNQIGRFAICSFHQYFSKAYDADLTRVQGVAIPSDFFIHQTTFEHLITNAEKLNTNSPFPYLQNA